jgi:hypothetical protein
MFMRPLPLHTSSEACVDNQRHVLHFLFGPMALPNGMRWRFAQDVGR